MCASSAPRDEQLGAEAERDRGVRIDDRLDQAGAIELLADIGEVRARRRRRGPAAPRRWQVEQLAMNRIWPRDASPARPATSATVMRGWPPGRGKKPAAAAAHAAIGIGEDDRADRLPQLIGDLVLGRELDEQQRAGRISRHRERRVDAPVDRRGFVEHERSVREHLVERRAASPPARRRSSRPPDSHASRCVFRYVIHQAACAATSRSGLRVRSAIACAARRIVDEAERDERLLPRVGRTAARMPPAPRRRRSPPPDAAATRVRRTARPTAADRAAGRDASSAE